MGLTGAMPGHDGVASYSWLGFPCYLVAVGIAFWSPVVTLVICGTLWVVWTIKAPMPSPEQ